MERERALRWSGVSVSKCWYKDARKAWVLGAVIIHIGVFMPDAKKQQ
jgi:hypothetical protein